MNSSEESDLPDLAVSMKASFRVRVCLQRYYSDVRSKCFIFVSKWKKVCWLEDRLRKLFSIKGCFYLCSQGHLLPSSEPLALLNPDDQVEVIPHESSHDAVDCINSTDTSANIIHHHNSEGHSFDRLDTKNATISTNDRAEKETKKQKFVNLSTLISMDIIDPFQVKENLHTYKEIPKDQNGMETEVCAKKVLEGNERLQDVKQKALALLDEQFGENLDGNEEQASSRRTRKRVRRRKRPQFVQIAPEPISASDTLLASDSSFTSITTPTMAITSTSPGTVTAPNNSVEVSSHVIINSKPPSVTKIGEIGPVNEFISRNDDIGPRKPRVVYALENI